MALRAALLLALLSALPLALQARAQGAQPAQTPAVERLLRDGFKSATPQWKSRLVQDATQKVCSATRNAPGVAAGAAIRRREKASIVYPSDGVFLGDWERGAAIAKSGYGGRTTDVEEGRANGGNCYACHQLDKREESYGTLGPSLAGYGKIRKFAAPFAKATYEHIYNPHASQACASMPRFGASGFLSIAQIKDLVAYLMSPESPVNK